MAKNQRVSLRGRGADLFFGDPSPTPPPATENQSEDEPRDTTAETPTRPIAAATKPVTTAPTPAEPLDLRAHKQASMHANAQHYMRDNTHANTQADLHTGEREVSLASRPKRKRASSSGKDRDGNTSSSSSSQHANERAGMPANAQDNRHASKPTRELASMHAKDHPVNAALPSGNDVLTAIWGGLSEPATLSNAFRFTDEELSQLTDVAYEISKRHNARVTKQDIVRLGLASLLWDYEQNGDTSLLDRYVVRKKKLRRGEQG